MQTVGRIIEVYFSNPTLNADDWQELSQIPHSFGVVIEGNTFSLGELNALSPAKHLDYVLLRNTKVDESDVLRFQQKRPDVDVLLGFPV